MRNTKIFAEIIKNGFLELLDSLKCPGPIYSDFQDNLLLYSYMLCAEIDISTIEEILLWIKK